MNASVTPRSNRQSGSVLLLSLVMLLVLTVLGIATMRTTIKQERMSYNDRDSQVALQAAELGLRNGEVWINNQADLPHNMLCVAPGAVPCRGADFPGVYMMTRFEPRFDQPLDFIGLTLDDWLLEGETLQDYPVATGVGGVAEQPRWIIREADILRDTLTLGRGDETRRYLYEITAIGVGSEPESQRLLQSTFIRRF